MLVAHDPIPFYNEKLMLYFTFCFDVDLIYILRDHQHLFIYQNTPRHIYKFNLGK